MRRGIRARTCGFLTLGPVLGQFFARCCRACLDRPAWASIFRPPPARWRATISPHWGLRRGELIVCGSWTDALGGCFDMIVSNPPYVASGEIAGLEPEVRDHDPRLALDGGEDGLAAYREIIPALPGLLAPSGVIALELGAGQHRSVVSLVREQFDSPVDIKLDLHGHERVILAGGGAVPRA